MRGTGLDAPFFKFDRECAKEIYTMGFPAAGENLQWHLATVILSRIILFYGVNSYAAYQLGPAGREYAGCVCIRLYCSICNS